MGPSFVLALVLYILGFVFFTYACIVVDPKTSAVARFMTERLPNYVGSKFQNLLGQKVMRYLVIIGDHLMVVFYLVLVLGSWSIMFTYGYSWITESAHVSNIHKYVGYVVFVVCMTSWRYASNASPGIITKRTMAKFDNFPYDNLLFVPNRICPTVGIRKLARSKYDRATGQHVARFDHFCGWLNQPIGEENYRFFLWFLLVHVAMCSYGTFVTGSLFWGEVVGNDLINATFFDMSSGKEVTSDYTIIAQYLFRRRFEVAAVFLLMGTMSVVLGAFLGFHVYITSRGMTTNESVKWKHVRRWHRQEAKRYRKAIKDGTLPNDDAQFDQNDGPSVQVPDGDVGCVGPKALWSQTETDPKEQPVMDPGAMPQNVYDNGFVENWKEVLSPRSLRQDAMDRWARSLLESNDKRTSSLQTPSKTKAS